MHGSPGGLAGLELNGRCVLVGALVIFVCWLPYICALFPGILWFDTSNQLYQLLTIDSEISTRHPLFDTMVFGAFFDLGVTLFNDGLAGLFVLCVLQSACTSAALSLQCCWLSRIGVGWGWRMAAVALFALCPIFPLFFITLAKDTICVPFFVVWCVAFEELMRRAVGSEQAGAAKGTVLAGAPWVVALVLSTCVQVLMKKASLYVVVGSLVPLALACGLRRWRILLASAVAVAVAFASVPLFNSAFVAATQRNVVDDWKQEAIAVPLQQVANAIRDDGGVVDEVGKDLLDSVYPKKVEKTIEKYDWAAADGVKRRGENDDNSEFLQAWRSVAPAHLDSYFEA